MARDDPQFNLRMTQELKDMIAERAKSNGRSMNSEIVDMLSGVISFGGSLENISWSLVQSLRAEDFSTLSEQEKRDREETLIDFAGMLSKRIDTVNSDLAGVVDLLAQIRGVGSQVTEYTESHTQQVRDNKST